MAARGPANPDTALYIAIFIKGERLSFPKGVANARLAEPCCLSDDGSLRRLPGLSLKS